jgi:hypothetical protein
LATRDAYRSGAMSPALASARSARSSAGPRSGGCSSGLGPAAAGLVLAVVMIAGAAQLPQASPRTSHRAQSMIIAVLLF